MHFQFILSTAALLTLASALPLNINLGAYSPALVVGDGEIAFEGGEGVESLVNSLQGAAQSGAAAQVGRDAPAPAQVVQAQVATSEGQESTAILTEPAGFPIPGAKREPLQNQLDPSPVKMVKKKKRDLVGFDRALQYAEVALTKGPKIELGTGEAGVGIIVDNNAANRGGAETGVVVE